jgi:GNAT superfamily N-acetyltransferase
MLTLPPMPWDIGVVHGRRELEQILALQRANLAPALSPAEARAQGFVTVEHDLDILERMHALAPSIVARDGERLAGYALAMPLAAQAYVPILASLFQLLGTLSWRGRPLPERSHYVMGQICVAKEYRGQGVFDALYQGHRAEYAARFDLLVTEIATRNTRSLRAHERVGFVPLHHHADHVDDWVIVGWDWQTPAP